jgi:DNA-binding CsgD family transcriptional regulator
MESVRIGFSRAEGHFLPSSTILVIGTGVFWTKQTCGLIEGEFDLPCLRFDSIEHAADLMPGLSTLRLVIVDEEFAEDLLARPARYFGLSAGASVAVAYRDVDLARTVDRGYDGAFGPMGYLPMRVPVDVWLCALRLLLHHERFLPCDLRAPREASDAPPAVVAPPSETAGRGGCNLDALTEREKEVLSLASVGNSNKVISRKLAISEHTVKLHMHHVYEKLGVANRTAAASRFRMEDAAS